MFKFKFLIILSLFLVGNLNIKAASSKKSELNFWRVLDNTPGLFDKTRLTLAVITGYNQLVPVSACAQMAGCEINIGEQFARRTPVLKSMLESSPDSSVTPEVSPEPISPLVLSRQMTPVVPVVAPAPVRMTSEFRVLLSDSLKAKRIDQEIALIKEDRKTYLDKRNKFKERMKRRAIAE